MDIYGSLLKILDFLEDDRVVSTCVRKTLSKFLNKMLEYRQNKSQCFLLYAHYLNQAGGWHKAKRKTLIHCVIALWFRKFLNKKTFM